MFCCALLYVHSIFAIILVEKRELVALLNLSTWCLVMIGWLFLAVPWGCLRFVIVVCPVHTHYLRLACAYEVYQHRHIQPWVNTNLHMMMAEVSKELN